VHHFGRSHDGSAEDLTDALKAQAYAEQRPPSARGADHVVGDTGILRTARSGADEDPVGVHLLDLRECDLVMTTHHRMCTEFTEVLDEVVDERVVVVDDKDVGVHGDEAIGVASRFARRVSYTVEMSSPKKRKVQGGRVTPKGTKPNVARIETSRELSDEPSPPWVLWLLFGLLGIGMIIIFLNYVGAVPGGETNNAFILLGLAFILGGIVTATRLR